MGDKYPGGGATDGGLELLGKPSAATQPGKRSLDYPALWQQMKPTDPFWTFDDLNHPVAWLGKPLAQLLAGIAAIGEDVTQPRKKRADQGQQAHRSVAILNVGSVYLQAQQMTGGVGDDVALAPRYFLAGVITARATALGGFHRLAVDHASRWARATSHRLTRLHHQHMVDLVPGAVVAPAIEMALNRRIRRKILGKLPPLAARGGDIEQRVHHRPQTGARSAAQFGKW